HHHHPAPQLSMSSDPKPREGTETLRRRIRDLFPRIGRQTQNPERGRKLPRRLAITTPTNGRQTQNPERGRKLDTDMTAVPHLTQSSDPKPREGTETRMVGKLALGSESSRQTQNPERGRKHHPTQAPKSMTSRRQTQNPERGRKPDGTELSGFYQVVVRPKTPRGDGNPHGGTWTSATIGVVRPKTPRGDGNWTQNRTGCGRCSSRQTQNPERGRKRISPATPQPRYCSMSSDPKPREGTETHRR
ncbi:hypothetical protein AN72_02917, partial [Mycobacterium tuberculosis M1288]